MNFVLDNAEQITQRLDEMINRVCPSANRCNMYGGIVFELEHGRHDTMVCGHFVYTKHVSLEFAKGYKLSDPDRILSGSGKYRRHIKFKSLKDIDRYPVQELLEQAFLIEQSTS